MDRGALGRPFALGLALFGIGLLIGGLAPSMPVLVGGAVHPGPGCRDDPAHRLRRDRPEHARTAAAADVRDALDRLDPAGVIGPALAGLVGETLGWRYVFLGMLPFIAVAGVLTHRAIAAVRVPETSAADEHLAGNAGRGACRPPCWSAWVPGLFMAGLSTRRAAVARRAWSSPAWSPACRPSCA